MVVSVSHLIILWHLHHLMKKTITECSQAYVPYYFFSSEHPAGRAVTSDWSVNSFMMVVCEVIF